MMGRGRLLVLCLLSVVLTTTACGSRLPKDVLQAIDAGRGNANGSGANNASSTGLDGTSADSNGGRPGSAVASGPLSTGSGGGGVTGSTGTTSAVQPGSKCAGAKSNAPGVTDKEIKVASIVTDSGPLPGATEGSYRGAAAYAAMVNSAGGVCGRKITVVKGDDGLDPAKARSEFLRLEPNVFAFVGAFAVADSGYTDLIGKTAAPYVSLVVDPSGRVYRNVMPKTPANYVNTGPFAWWKKTHPKVSQAALLYANIGGVTANVPGFVAAIKHVGFHLQYSDGADVTSPDYTPEVQNAQDRGIQFLYLFAFEVNMHVRFVRAMRQQNYDPPIKGANIAFNTRFSELLGKEGDGWENHNTSLMYLDPKEPARSPGLTQFVDWNNRVFPGAQLDLFPVSGWANSQLFVTAMSKIQGDITRENLIKALYTIHSFDGGGIQAAVDPTTGLGPPCFNMAIHKGGHWVREFPTSALFECHIGESYKYK
jgi:ABC-type branched-subunit amino acid transport system substrate-binding protein